MPRRRKAYRRPLLRWLVVGVGVPLSLVPFLVATAMDAPFPLMAVGFVASIFWVTEVWSAFRAAVVVSPDGVVVRNQWRSFSVPWSDVAAFTLERDGLRIVLRSGYVARLDALGRGSGGRGRRLRARHADLERARALHTGAAAPDGE